ATTAARRPKTPELVFRSSVSSVSGVLTLASAARRPCCLVATFSLSYLLAFRANRHYRSLVSHSERGVRLSRSSRHCVNDLNNCNQSVTNCHVSVTTTGGKP